MIKAVRGTRDLLPPETATWEFVENVARDVFRSYDFGEIRTPIFEETQLFARSVGEETDIVSKEMFTFEDRTRMQRVVTPDPTAEAVEALLNLTHPGPPAPVRESQPRAHGASLTLRPENTAGVVRAYIEHKLWERPGVQKLYYLGPQFRRERPQKGRFRQFYQIGAEVIGPPSAGSESAARDAEVLQMLADLLIGLGLPPNTDVQSGATGAAPETHDRHPGTQNSTGWTLELNSVGCPKDRHEYYQALRAALAPVTAQMCADCRRRAQTNPLRVFDCKVPTDQSIIETLPKVLDFLDEPCREHLRKLRGILDHLKLRYRVNPRLVRGLDYYQRTTFEFTHAALGAQNAILGGGRYDGLSEALDGPRAPGIGFAIGEDRLVMAIQKQSLVAGSEATIASRRLPGITPVHGRSAARGGNLGAFPRVSAIDAYLAPLGPGTDAAAAELARDLRSAGLRIELGDETFRLKKSLETADKQGARYVLIVGENEIKSQQFALRDLKNKEQIEIPRNELVARMTQINEHGE